ncbi:hypothetical protein INT45_013940 [Circinella minor]|uniref:Homeobox domain-containing protein n=1 Tax=Circinella minor TaxID=1195481 RepID=A0A8H7VNK0_9FUNG|nr:hypothetical protein INT45_013940 [Circinella minor]
MILPNISIGEKKLDSAIFQDSSDNDYNNDNQDDDDNYALLTNVIELKTTLTTTSPTTSSPPLRAVYSHLSSQIDNDYTINNIKNQQQQSNSSSNSPSTPDSNSQCMFSACQYLLPTGPLITNLFDINKKEYNQEPTDTFGDEWKNNSFLSSNHHTNISNKSSSTSSEIAVAGIPSPTSNCNSIPSVNNAGTNNDGQQELLWDTFSSSNPLISPPDDISLQSSVTPTTTATNTMDMYSNSLSNNNAVQQRYCCSFHYHRYYPHLYHYHNNNGYCYYTSYIPLSAATSSSNISTASNNNFGGAGQYDVMMMYSTNNNRAYVHQQQQQQQQQQHQLTGPALRLFDTDHDHCRHRHNIDTLIEKKNITNANINFENNTILTHNNVVGTPLYAHPKDILMDSSSGTSNSSDCSFSQTSSTATGTSIEVDNSKDELSSDVFSTSTFEKVTNKNIDGYINEDSSKKPISLLNAGPSYIKKMKRRSIPPVTALRGQAIPGMQKSRRTKTSYDPKTSYELNVLFFETFGMGRKPTKQERYKVQHKTGINSRRLTYWICNHKRRFNAELQAYNRLILEKEIEGYDDFVDYCKTHVVPELQHDEQQDNNNNNNNNSRMIDVDQHRNSGNGGSNNINNNNIESDDDDDDDSISTNSSMSDNNHTQQ